MALRNIKADLIYHEKLKSTGTSLLFGFLAALFFLLFGWRFSIVGWRFLPSLYLALGFIFFLYVINYRVLEIYITEEHLTLKFGLIPWKTKLANIKNVEMDESPPIIKYGGAGVHFAFVEGKYRAFYNFLEFPRIVVYLNEKQGLVQALVFSTKQPDRLLAILESRTVKS
jgi:hypothetical protein